MKKRNKFLKVCVFTIIGSLVTVGIGYFSVNQHLFLTKNETSSDIPSSGGEVTPPSTLPDADDFVEGTSQKQSANSEIHLKTSTYDETYKAIQQLITDSNATIETISIYSSQDTKGSATAQEKNYRTVCLSINVLAGDRDLFLDKLQNIAALTSLNTYSYDQTQSYIDIESRLKNLAVQEEKYRDLVTKAATIDEILKIEPELSRVRTDIETLTEQKSRIDDQINHSQIVITLEEVDASYAQGANFFELIQVEWAQNINQIFYLFQWGAVKLIGFIPYIIVLSPVILLIAFWVRRFKKHKSD